MNDRILRPGLAALILLVPAAARAQQPPAPAPPPAPPAADVVADESRDHFKRGVQLFRENDFRSALVEFRRAHELSGSYKILYNIGQTEYELQDYAGALRSFQRYLDKGGAEIEQARRAEVEGELAKLKARVATLEIKSNAAGAEVLVDDVPMGKTPLAEPLLVSMGRRKVILQKGGVASAPRFVDLAGGDKLAVSVELAEAGVPRPAPLPVAPPPAEPAPSRTGLWIGVGVTAALVAGTAVTGVLALGAQTDAQKKLDTFGVKASDVTDARSKMKTLALVTDILGGASLAMAGVTIVLGVTGGKSDKSDKAAPKAATITVGPRSLVLGGTF
ncbi:MAG: PEGA domain-containing protein [Byssovorax sp.]